MSDGGRWRRLRSVALALVVVAAVVGVLALGYLVVLAPQPAEREVTAREIAAALPASPIGGGAGYGGLPPSEATVVVRTRSGIRSALNASAPGDVVYVAGNATINLTGAGPLTVPGNVTLASDRGVNGSKGGLLYTDRGENGTPLFETGGDDVRITGLRLRGYGRSWTPAARDRPRAWGVFVRRGDDHVEIANNRISHFVGICVQGGGDDLDVHHNTIRYCNQLGFGYGVNVGRAAVVECNYFDHVRHAVAAPGWPGNGYAARYNVVGPHVQNHQFDMHPPGGAFVDIEHNTVLATSRYGSRRHRVPSVKVGVSTDTSTVRRNWFFQNASLAIWQGRVHGPPYDAAKYDNLVVQDNSFGRHVPPAGVGAFAGTNASATAC